MLTISSWKSRKMSFVNDRAGSIDNWKFKNRINAKRCWHDHSDQVSKTVLKAADNDLLEKIN